MEFRRNCGNRIHPEALVLPLRRLQVNIIWYPTESGIKLLIRAQTPKLPKIPGRRGTFRWHDEVIKY